MRSATLALSGALLLSGALAAQEHSRPGVAATPAPEVPANRPSPGSNAPRKILVSIRSAVGRKDAVALRSASDAYVANILALTDDIGRLSRSGSLESPDPLAIGKRFASQATDLESLATTVPRHLRKDVDRALAAADALLGSLARGRSSPEPRIEPRSEPDRRASHVH